MGNPKSASGNCIIVNDLWIGYAHVMPDTWRERLQAAFDETNMNVAELMRRAGVPATAWHDIMKRGQNPSVDRLARLASALGRTLDEIYLGTETDLLQLAVTGACTEGEMWEELDARGMRAVPFRMIGDDMVAVSVETMEFEPTFRRGDVLCGRRMIGHALDNVIGKDCIVATKDGERYIKTLQRGTKPGRFTLRSIRRSPDITDVRVDWVAPITMILRES